MSKVLTYHNQSNGEHWFTYEAYAKKHIDAIQDPEDGKSGIAPTSVPSPFAQMDLVKTAFKNISKKDDLSGTNIDLKLVSECLDVGELFFNKETFADRIQIITWDKQKDLPALLNSPNVRHRRLGEALELYLEQDANAYNFDLFNKLFLIQFDNDPRKVVGGTSPSTLFFTSSNDMSFAKISMPNNMTLFDNNYMHLYQRGEEYQLFLYSLRLAMPEFGVYFKDFSEYLDKNLAILEKKNPQLYSKITQLTRESYQKDFNELTTGIANEKVLVHRFPLRAKSGEGRKVDSDFEIRATKTIDGRKPLVLQKGHDGMTQDGRQMIYFSHPYDRDTNVPYESGIPISNIDERPLPGFTGVKYPHLLISDFLEPYLIKLPYPVNKERYFNGALKNSKDHRGYILPINKNYFKYFNLKDLMEGHTDDGSRFFEMEARSGDSVRVILRVPIKAGYITFERMYTLTGNNAKPEIERNKGVILENQFGVTIYPFIKMGNPDLFTHHRVLLGRSGHRSGYQKQ